MCLGHTQLLKMIVANIVFNNHLNSQEMWLSGEVNYGKVKDTTTTNGNQLDLILRKYIFPLASSTLDALSMQRNNGTI